MRNRLVGFYDYTVVVTYIGMLCGFIGMTFAMKGNYNSAFLCLFFSCFCDMIDGSIAGTKKDRTDDERNFGIQIDSLSDVITFGVLPAIIVSSYCQCNTYTVAVASFYVLCALIRLAYYNVDEMNRQKAESNSHRAHFIGLPTPGIVVFLPIVFALSSVLGSYTGIVATVVMLIVGLLFVMPVKIKKPGNSGKVISAVCLVVLAVIFARFKVM